MKIATWNVNSLRVRLPHVLQWLEEVQPDVLALQETKSTDEQFPLEEIKAAGYHVIFSGQKTYNGVALLSKSEGCDPVTDFPGFDDPSRRVLAATYEDVRILNVYIPNGAAVSSDKYEYKLNWLKHLESFIRDELKKHKRFVVLGDFNIAPEEIDVYDPKVWEGQVLFSPPEREAFRSLIALGLKDLFRLFNKEPGNYSWWDYRAAAFRRNLGVRIDHILASELLSVQCQSCTIDKRPRAWERPSDHVPVLSVFSNGPSES